MNHVFEAEFAWTPEDLHRMWSVIFDLIQLGVDHVIADDRGGTGTIKIILQESALKERKVVKRWLTTHDFTLRDSVGTVDI